MIEIGHVVLLGIVEGLTEFIPVSSTGHLIIVGHLIGFVGAKAKTFEVFIQLGAILAVVIQYRSRFIGLLPRPPQILGNKTQFSGLFGLALLALTTLPALVAGAAVHSYIKRYLFGPTTVALGLGIGGAIILLTERSRNPKRIGLDTLTWKDALAIGCFQCLALWPGVSRSGATIVGAMMIGIERKTAAEYSFIAAVPVMLAATTFDLYKTAPILQTSDYLTFCIGFSIAFISALISIRIFTALLGRITLRPFGWYRIGISPVIYGFMR